MNKVSDKKSLWNVLRDNYAKEIFIVIAFVVIHILIGVMFTTPESYENKAEKCFACMIVYYVFYVCMICVCVIFCALPIVKNIIAMLNRYKKIPITEEEFSSLNLNSVDKLIDFIDNNISYKIYFLCFHSQKYLPRINRNNINQLVEIYKKQHPVTDNEFEKINTYLSSLKEYYYE